jgi:AAHS family 3-hydroxyphenylpropionic acid transporter
MLCGAAALLEGFDNQSMGVAAPRLIAEFGLSAGQSGIMFSGATLGLFLGAAVGGRVADYLGRKRALIASLLLFGLFSLATASVNGPTALYVIRLLTGLGLGGSLPNYIALSSEAAPAERRVSVVTMVMAAMPLGGALAGLMALAGQLGWGWRSIFYLGGTTPIMLAVLMMYRLPESREFSRGRAARAGGSRVARVSTVLFAAGRAPTTLMLWASFFFTQLVLLLILNWLPSLIIGLGFTHAQASWASVWFNLAGSLGSGYLGHLHAGERRRMWVIMTYTGIATTLTAVALTGTEFALTAIACALAGVFINGAQMILYASAPLYYGTVMRGTGVGATVAVGRLGSVAGPLLAGALLASGGSSAAVLLAIVPFVAVGGGAALALTWRAPCSE